MEKKLTDNEALVNTFKEIAKSINETAEKTATVLAKVIIFTSVSVGYAIKLKIIL